MRTQGEAIGRHRIWLMSRMMREVLKARESGTLFIAVARFWDGFILSTLLECDNDQERDVNHTLLSRMVVRHQKLTRVATGTTRSLYSPIDIPTMPSEERGARLILIGKPRGEMV